MKQQFENVRENALVEKLVKLVKSDTKIVQIMGQLHVLEELAFIFSAKVAISATMERVPETKKLTRTLRTLTEEFNKLRRQEINPELLGLIQKTVEEFVQECSRDFYILWLSVNAELKKKYPDAAYIDMRTDAYVAKVFLVAARRMSREANARLMRVDIKMNMLKHCQALDELLDAYVGDFQIEFDNHIETCYRILIKKCEQTDFTFISNDK